MRRLAGIAGLGYVLGAAVENMGILGSPLAGSPAADIRPAFADESLHAVTLTAGAVSLVAYCVFAVALVRFVRASGGTAAAALAGGIGGPLLAAAGLAAGAPLVFGAALSDSTTETLFDLSVHARLAAGPLMGLFLLAVASAALHSGTLPRALAAAAHAIAAPLVLTPVAALTGSHAFQVAAVVAFGLNSLWILFASLWLVLAEEAISPATLVRRAAFLMLALAAGSVGLALLVVPGSSATFFSWGLAPEPLAAFAGGAYLGSAAVYACALRAPWLEARGLVLGAVVLSVSVFAITLVHLEVFDFDRLQAWAWVVLFALFSAITIGLLLFAPHEARTASARLAPTARAGLAAVAALLASLAVALWADPSALAGGSPFELPPLGGRFAGSWVALLSVLAGWAALRGTRDEARFPALALIALPAGALAAGLRTLPQLDHAGAYLAAAAALALAGAAILAAVGRPRRQPSTTATASTSIRQPGWASASTPMRQSAGL
jgi:hypothetical protein